MGQRISSKEVQASLAGAMAEPVKRYNAASDERVGGRVAGVRTLAAV